MNRDQQKQATREKLLAVAEQLFKQHGYDQVSTRQIATQANVAVGTLFAHFPDKAQLTQALFFAKLETLLANIFHNIPGQLTGRAYFYFFAEQLYALYAEDRRFSLALLKNALSDMSFFQAQMDEFVAMIAEQLQQENNRLDDAGANSLAKAFFSFYFMQLVQGLNDTDSVSADWLQRLKFECDQLWQML